MLLNGPGTTQDLWICCRSFAMSPRVEQDLQKEVKKIAYFISEFGSPGLWGWAKIKIYWVNAVVIRGNSIFVCGETLESKLERGCNWLWRHSRARQTQGHILYICRYFQIFFSVVQMQIISMLEAAQFITVLEKRVKPSTWPTESTVSF